MNINVIAACLARRSLGHGIPTAADVALADDAETMDDAIRSIFADLMEGSLWNSFEEEADMWLATLMGLSEKQIRASWPVEAGVK